MEVEAVIMGWVMVGDQEGGRGGGMLLVQAMVGC